MCRDPLKPDFVHDRHASDETSVHYGMNPLSERLCLREDDGTKELGSSLKDWAPLMGSHHFEQIYWLLTYKLSRSFSQQ